MPGPSDYTVTKTACLRERNQAERPNRATTDLVSSGMPAHAGRVSEGAPSVSPAYPCFSVECYRTTVDRQSNGSDRGRLAPRCRLTKPLWQRRR